MDLADLGYDDGWRDALAAVGGPSPVPVRVVRASRSKCWGWGEDGTITARIPGRLHHTGDVPVVGDWAVVEATNRGHLVRAVLPRRTAFRRRAAGGRRQAQVVAANVDRIFVVMGLDRDFNLRRLERYLALTTGGGAEPIVVLNKTDRCLDLIATCDAVKEVAASAPVVSACALRGDIDGLAPFLVPASTVALIGSSGVGKSTLLNALLGEQRMDTGPVRERDDRGRHTTTHRELFRLPGGALLIDTPGMRELGMIEGAFEGLSQAFGEILALAEGCRFRDCRHDQEPGCAVREAVHRGQVSEARVDSYRRLAAEARDAAG